VASGLPTDSFRFSGFLPAKAGQRRKVLEEIRESPRTQVFYEAPHRLQETLADIADVLGPERHVVVAREVTKLHEEFLRGRADEILGKIAGREVKGEITLLIGKGEAAGQAAASKKKSAKARLSEIANEEQLDEKAALKRLAKELGVSKSEAYRRVQQS
jgi:16S rRNA (cytidine1402-2'-O)-methyltransferase